MTIVGKNGIVQLGYMSRFPREEIFEKTTDVYSTFIEQILVYVFSRHRRGHYQIMQSF